MNLKSLIVVFCFLSFFNLKSQVAHVKSRNFVSIDNWSFKKGIHNNAFKINYNTTSWDKVTIPHTYSMDATNGIGYYRGQAWYRTSFTVPKSMKNQRVFIRFEGVGQDIQLYINQKKVGKHSGGYSAFCFDITDFLNAEKENIFALKVTNEPNFKRIPVNDKLFNLYGGIYRPVQIFSTPKTHILPTHFASSGVFVETKKVNKNNAEIEVRTHLKSSKENAVLHYYFSDAANKTVLKETLEIPVAKENQIIKKQFSIANPILWNGKKNPHLYNLKVVLKTDSSEDVVVQKFGIRTFSVDANRGFILNNKEYRLYGVAMHQEWKSLGPALKLENHKKDLSLVDEIGATSLRLSHYQHSDYTYQLANELGLIVWSEIPYVHDWSGREGGNAKQQFKELILQNYNHPSVCFWGLWNEVRAWSNKNAPPVKLAEQLQTLAKQLDSNRITVSASDRKMESLMSRISDLQSFNKYYGWYYGENKDLGVWLDKTHIKYPKVPLSVSEYGVGGNIYHQEKDKLQKPSGAYFPEQIQTEYHQETWKIIKDRPFVWGSFIWNMFDFSVAGWNRGGIPNLNHKGLVTFDRKTKKDAFYFYKANWSDEPVLHIAERRNIKRKNSKVKVKVFTNLPKVSLWVNGKKVATKKIDSDIHIVEFENIILKEGKNKIKVLDSTKKLNDFVEWYFEK